MWSYPSAKQSNRQICIDYSGIYFKSPDDTREYVLKLPNAWEGNINVTVDTKTGMMYFSADAEAKLSARDKSVHAATIDKKV